jgi:hypothetical protein
MTNEEKNAASCGEHILRFTMDLRRKYTVTECLAGLMAAGAFGERMEEEGGKDREALAQVAFDELAESFNKWDREHDQGLS